MLLTIFSCLSISVRMKNRSVEAHFIRDMLLCARVDQIGQDTVGGQGNKGGVKGHDFSSVFGEVINSSLGRIRSFRRSITRGLMSWSALWAGWGGGEGREEMRKEGRKRERENEERRRKDEKDDSI